MAGETIFSDDIIANILAWLPPKHIARVRVVCKQWHALTSEHHFMHTNFLRNRAGHSIAGFFLNNELHRKLSYNPLHTTTSNNLTPDLSFIPHTPDTVPGKIYVTSSCNGLLICRRPIDNKVVYKARCYVCNPVTKKCIEIDVPDGAGYYMNLAYDPSKSQHYKIIARGFNNVHVYSSQTRSWRTVLQYERSNNPFAGLHHSRSVFWNGSLVWMVSRSLLRFVIDGEELNKLPMPPRPEKGWICGYIGESGGHLQMIGYTQEERLTACLDVLEMRGDCSEWSVLYRVDLTRVKELYPDTQMKSREHSIWGRGGKVFDYLAIWPLLVTRGTAASGQHGVLLFGIPGKIMSYDVEDQEISVVWEDTAPARCFFRYTWFDFYPYSPGLFDL